MKIHAFRKIIISGIFLAATGCACLLPQSSAAQIPSDILSSSPLAQVIKLAQGGVGESVILAYINNSANTFNLTSDQIIYLKDIGLPDDAVTAMMQRDQQLGATAAETPPPATETATVQPVEVTQNYFYDTLSPYGGWVDVDGYGLCWQPTVVVNDSGWQPYCEHGHWVYTDDGWYWLSDYSWGGTAFHYGRWFHDPRHGWCWWPDTVWAPSWVCWRYSDDYCGWAPLPPRCVFREGVGIVYNGAVVSAGFDFGISVNFFTFVPVRNFCDPHPERFRISHDRAPVIYNQTTVINNFNFNSRDHTVINAGITPEHITAVTRAPVPRATIRESSAPGRHNEQLSRGEVIVNRPHFNNADPAAPLHQNVLPHPVQANRPNTPRPPIMDENRNNPNKPNPVPRNVPPPQNNFSRPDNFSQPNHNPPQAQMENQNQPARPNGSPYQRPNNISPPAEKNYPPPAQNIPPESRRVIPPQTSPEQPRVVPPESRPTPAPPVEHPNYSPPEQRIAPQPPQSPPRNFNPRQNDSPPADSRPSRVEPPAAVQPHEPPAQAPAAAAPAAQKNFGKQDKNQNGQQQ